MEVVKPTPKPKKSRTPLFSFKKNTTATVNETANANSTTNANSTANATEAATESAEPTPLEPTPTEPVVGEDKADDKASADAAASEAVSEAATPTPEPVKVMKKVVHRIPLKVTADFSNVAVRPLTERQRGKSLRTYVVRGFCGWCLTPGPERAKDGTLFVWVGRGHLVWPTVARLAASMTEVLFLGGVLVLCRVLPPA